MDSTKIKEILGKQLELLAEVSEGKPGDLTDLSVAMCEIADRLMEVQDPLTPKIHINSTPNVEGDRKRLADAITAVLSDQIQGKRSEQSPGPTAQEPMQDEEPLLE